MKKFRLFYPLLLIFIVTSCAKDQWFDPPPKGAGNNNSPYNLISPKIKIAVISDIHYLDPKLKPEDVSNQDFQAVMAGDRKIVELSDPIFRRVVDEVCNEGPDIMLIPGD